MVRQYDLSGVKQPEDEADIHSYSFGAEIAMREQDLCPLPLLIFMAQYFGTGRTVAVSQFVRFEVHMTMTLNSAVF
jgi:hypothetical protein